MDQINEDQTQIRETKKSDGKSQMERYPRQCGTLGFNWGFPPFAEKEYTSEDFKKDGYVSASVSCECSSGFSSSTSSDACRVEEIPRDWFIQCDETEYEVKNGRGTEGMSFVGDNPICQKKEGKCEFGSPYEHEFVDGVCSMKAPVTCREGTVRTSFMKKGEMSPFFEEDSLKKDTMSGGVCRWMDNGIQASRKDEVGNGFSMPDKIEFGFKSDSLPDGAHALFHLEEGGKCTFNPSTKSSVPTFQVRKRGNESTLEVVVGTNVTSIPYKEGISNLVRWEYGVSDLKDEEQEESVDSMMRKDTDKKQWSTRLFLNDDLVHQERMSDLGTNGKLVQMCAPVPSKKEKGGLVLSQPLFQHPNEEMAWSPS